ncbi:MAG TPA: zinc-dependent metalloprotease family protein [Tepidisphaeraceae bacterium]|nr:zinc-dependent metalloprotease family protein [Tepidisphaeraceae bacterium]
MRKSVKPSATTSHIVRGNRTQRAGASAGGGSAEGATRAAVEMALLEPRRLLASTIHDVLAIRVDNAIKVRDYAEIWQPLDHVTPPSPNAKSHLRIDEFKPFKLDARDLTAALARAPMEFTPAADKPVEVAIPTPSGKPARFAVVETLVMDPKLAAKFSTIKTYRGQGIDDPTATVRLDYTPAGFHAQVIAPGKTFYVDPYWHGSTSAYASYWYADMEVSPELIKLRANPHQHDHGGKDDDHAEEEPLASATLDVSSATASRTSGTQLRTYRTAVAATGEYTAFHGGTVTLGQAAIVTAINRVTGIYESELTIRLQLIADNSTLVFTNASTDPYTNNDGGAMLSQNQTTIDSRIGSANYDIGHVFSTGGGGVAYLGVVGINGYKAGGVTGLPSPTGDAFYVDYVAHEMGHQFGANHTFNTSTNSNRNASTAYEPGGGSTIMAYAGITNDNLQNFSDPYFSFISFDEIMRHVDVTVPTVGTRTNTGNFVPSVNAGADYTIPASTPFALTATGSDGNGDVLSYSWEQMDLGPARQLEDPDNGSSPLFRVYNPTTNPTRTFPRLESILNGTNATPAPSGGLAERLPTLARAMDFRVTARDNRSGGGGINIDDMVVNVVNTGAVFSVTSFNSSTTVAAGSSQTITWNVAGTTGSGINAANVNIFLSTDGGLTFPTLLASSTANDGTETITLPNLNTSQARLKVQPTNNIFFDINNANFVIGTATVGDPDDQIGEASAFAVGATVNASIDPAGDVDMYAVTAAAGQTLRIDVDLPTTGLDSYLRLFNASGTQLAANDDSSAGPAPEYSGLESFIEYTFSTAGTYYVGVSAYQNSAYDPVTGDGDNTSTSVGPYTLTITSPAPTTGANFEGTSGADNWLLRRSVSGTDYEILVGGVVTHVLPVASTSSIFINLAGGNDALTIDYVNGIPFPSGGVRYDGGGLSSADTDTLTVNGSGNNDAISLVNGNVTPMAGHIALHPTTGGASVESVTVNGNAGNDSLFIDQALFATVTYNGGTNTGSGTAGDTINFNASNGDDTISITSTSFIGGGNNVSFSALEAATVNAMFGFDTINIQSNPANLTVNGHEGQDVFNVLQTSGLALTLNGGVENDRFNFGGATTGNVDAIGGGITIAGGDGADVLNYNDQNNTFDDTYTLTATTVARSVSGTVTFGSVESLAVNAGSNRNPINASVSGGNLTSVTLSGGAGDDAFDVTPSSTAIFRVIGGTHTAGDSLTLTLAGATGQTLDTTLDANGYQQYTFSNRMAVKFKEIETGGTPPGGDLVYTGTAGADNWLLRRSTAGTQYEIFVGGVLTHVLDASTVNSLSFNLAGGNDALTIDYVNGAPMPTGGIRYDGGGLASADFDTLTINGSANGDTFNLINAGGVTPLAGNIALHTPSGGMTVDSVTVNGGAGNDTLNIDQVVFAAVTFNGGTETDTLNFKASQGTDDDVFINTGNLSGGGNRASYTGLEQLNVSTLASGDIVTVNTGSGAPATTIDLGDWQDTVNILAANTAPITILGGNGDDKLFTDQTVSAPITFIGGAGSDTIEYRGTNGTDTINVTGTTITKSGFPHAVGFSETESLLINALASTDTINASVTGTGPTTVTIDGGTESDTFNITPSSTALFRIIGGSPTTAPGDTLTITQAGAIQTGNVGPSSESGFEQISYSNRQPVRFKEIETLGSGIEQPPAIGGLTDSPDPVEPGASVTLTATGVSDPNGGAVTVLFYRETNGTAGLQVGSDTQVGADSSDPYSVSITAPAALGTYTYYAQVTDSTSRTSNVVSTTHTVADLTPPVVTEVFAGSTAWESSFRNFLQSSGQGDATYGYRLSAAQHADELMWINLNQVSVRFSENVNLAAGAFRLFGVRTPQYAGNISYDPATFTATFALGSGAFINEKLLVHLLADSITDTNGNALDGEWTNPPETNPVTAGGADTYPSGNGTPGGDFAMRLNVLPGDVTRDGEVVGNDVTSVRLNQGYLPGQSGYTIFRDVTGDGEIIGNDVTAVRFRQGIVLPAGTPTVPLAAPETTERRSLFSTGASITLAEPELESAYELLNEEHADALLS